MTAIRALLERDFTSLEIVRYLVQHSEAADTARGISEWWIHRDLPKTAEALSLLEKLGVVRSYLVQDAITVYGYTKNPLLREGLRQFVGSANHATATERA